MTAPTRFPYGISTNTPIQTLANFGMPDPTEYHTLFDDFNIFTAANWIVTETGAAGTVALTAGNNGLLLITTDALDNDAEWIQSLVGSFLPVAGKKLFFKAKFQASEATQSDIIFGLQIIDTTPLDATDGIYFYKADGAATFDVFVRKNATTGSNTGAAVGTLAADTDITLGFYFDGIETTSFFINDILVKNLSSVAAYLPDAALAMSFGYQNGAAGAETMTVDYVFAAMER